MSNAIGTSYTAPSNTSIPSGFTPTGSHMGAPNFFTSAGVTSNHSNVRYTAPVFAQPFKEGWETSYREGMFLWGSASSYARNRQALFSCATLNYYLEKSSVEDLNTRSLGGMASRAPFHASTPEQVLAEFGPLGVIGDQQTSSMTAAARATDRLIGYSPSGTLAKTFNLFSADLHQADQCYFVVKKIQSPYQFFLNPDGAIVSNRTDPRLGKILQVVGLSDKDGTRPYHNTHQDDADAMDVDNWCLDYMEKERAVSQVYKITEVDENGKVIEREVDSGDTEALPQLVYDAYATGSLYRIGTVVHPPKKTTQASTIVRAHRDNNLMITLPRIELSLRYDFV